MASQVTPSRRLVSAVVLGVVIGTVVYRIPPTLGYEAGDLTIPLRAARTLLKGGAPYGDASLPPSTRLLYPLPAVLLLMPLAGLSPQVAGAVWAGLGMAILSWVAFGRFGVQGLAVAFSRSAVRATALSQWSPLFLLGAVTPAAQVIAAAKPTLALLVFAYRPTRWAVIGSVVLATLAFFVRPTWLGEWLAQVQGVSSSYAPAALIWRGGGPLLLLAALRWRRPDARLLLAMAVVPHHYVWYDQLLLFLVPERPREVWALWALSWLSGVVAGILFARSVAPDLDGRQMAFRAPIVALMYLPCLAMVLRRPNVA